MAIGDSAGLLLRIKADGSQAKRELSDVKGSIGGLGGAITALGGPTALAGAALAGIGTAAAAAMAGIVRLTVATSEFGSKLYDASVQTGLSAAAISALKVAADTSGSSLEAVSGSVAKLNVLLGQAAQGNEKAEATLKRYNITATDANEAFAQAVKVIGQMTGDGEKAAAMLALFKDRTGEVGKIVDAVNGDFEAFIETARELGLVLSEEDLRAADAFGDTLDILGKQAAATGQRFALELMPNATHAMESISKAMGGNQDIARAWGREVGDVIRGMEIAYSDLRFIGEAALEGLNQQLGSNIAVTMNWARAILPTLGIVGQTLNALSLAGQKDPLPGGFATAKIGTDFGKGFSRPSVGGAGGGGRGGGRTGRSAKQQPTQFDVQSDALQRQIQLYEANLKKEEAALALSLTSRLISELDHIKKVNEGRIRAIEVEINENKKLLDAEGITADEQINLENKIAILRKKLAEARLEYANEVLKKNQEITEEENEAAKKRQEEHEKELRRIQELKDARSRAREQFLDDQRRGREQRDPFGTGRKKGGANDWLDWDVSAGGDFLTGLNAGLGALQEQLPLMQELGQALADIFGQLANAVGQVTRNFVLFGSAGTSFRKFAAEVIASIAQMAVVKALFEFAEAAAMMGLFWFTGNGKFLKSAKEHALAGVAYGLVGAAAVGAGRLAAGNAFSQAAGSATGSGGGGSSNDQQNTYTTPFGGFGGRDGGTISSFMRQQKDISQRQTLVLGQLEETVHKLATRIDSIPPVEVLTLGAAEDPSVIGRANEEYLGNSGATGTTNFLRNTGQYR